MTRTALLLLLAGCTGGSTSTKPTDTPVAEPTGPVHPLAEATATPWLQRVLFEAQPGERIEGIGVSQGKGDRALVVTLIDPKNVRRSVRVGRDGTVTPMNHVVSENSRGSLSDIGPDGHTRAQVEVEGGDALLRLIDTVGGDPRTLVRDNKRVLRHPSFNADQSAVYLDEGSDLGGIWRVAVADGTVTRVVPDKDAATPVAFAGISPQATDAVAFVEEKPGDLARIIVAEPATTTPVELSAFSAAVPPELWPAVEDQAGKVLRVKGCDDQGALRFEPAAGGLRVAALGPALVDKVVLQGASYLLGRTTPGGAVRVVGMVTKKPEAWAVDLGFSQGALVSDLWVGGAEAAALPVISSCAPAVPDSTWLQVPLWVGEARATLSGVEVNEREVTGHGVRGVSGQPFVVHARWDGAAPRIQPTAQKLASNPLAASGGNGAVEAMVQQGAVMWTKGRTGALLPADPLRNPVAIAFGAQAATLLVADGDAEPGVDEVDTTTGAARRIARAPARALAAFDVDGSPRVAWTETTGGRPLIIAAQPMTAAEQAAWKLGPASAVGLVPLWVPAHVESGTLARCQGELGVAVQREGDALTLQVGAQKATITAVVQGDDGIVRVLGAGPGGDPRVLIEIQPDPSMPPANGMGGARVIDRMGGFARQPESVAWYPIENTAKLPVGGACKMFQ